MRARVASPRDDGSGRARDGPAARRRAFALLWSATEHLIIREDTIDHQISMRHTLDERQIVLYTRSRAPVQPMSSPAPIVVFPGQGSQRSGMGRDFHAEHAAARQVYEEGSDALGLDLPALCFEDDARLGLTEFAQPAIVATEIAMLRALQTSTDLSVAAWGGHSLGEYTALVAAGALPLATALRIVRTRGRLMQDAVPAGHGRMVAVIGPDLDVDRIAHTVADLVVDIANDNSRDQTVLSGLVDDVRTAETRLAPLASRLVELDVSAPFHSRLMAGIEPAFAAELRESSGMLAADRATAVTSNVSGGFHEPDPDVIVHRLVRQLSGTVRWRSNMDALRSAGGRVLEVGPAAPLRGFFRTVGLPVEPITSVRALDKLAARHDRPALEASA